MIRHEHSMLEPYSRDLMSSISAGQRAPSRKALFTFIGVVVLLVIPAYSLALFGSDGNVYDDMLDTVGTLIAC